MSIVAAIRSTTGSGFIRRLSESEHGLLCDHLMRLDPTSRHDRFNGGISDGFLATYAARCFDNDTIVIAYLQDGEVHAAAELHAAGAAAGTLPEVAFSVEDRLRRQGVGSALFEQILTEARRRGYQRLRVTTGGQNVAMKALARKFGAHLSFVSGEATGTIDLTRHDEPQDEAIAPPQHDDVPLAPLLPAWALSAPSITLVRDMARTSQTMWSQLFKLYADLLKARPGLGTR